MTKNDVYDFVLKVRRKAVASIDEKAKKEMDKEKKKIYKKYAKEITAINSAIEDLKLASNMIVCKMSKDKEIDIKEGRYIRSSTLEGYIKNLSQENIVYNMFSDNGISNIGNLNEIGKKYMTERNMVIDEYTKVETKCREIKSAKKCVEYLNELGFDTSSLEVKKETKLEVKDINKDMLFVCGDNK